MNRNYFGLRVWQWLVIAGSASVVWGFTKGRGT